MFKPDERHDVYVFATPIRSRDIVKVTFVATMTIATMTAVAKIVTPKLEKLHDEIKTETSKWKYQD